MILTVKGPFATYQFGFQSGMRSQLSPEIIALQRVIDDLEQTRQIQDEEFATELSPAFADLDLAISQAAAALEADPEDVKAAAHLMRYLQTKLSLLRMSTETVGAEREET